MGAIVKPLFSSTHSFKPSRRPKTEKNDNKSIYPWFMRITAIKAVNDGNENFTKLQVKRDFKLPKRLAPCEAISSHPGLCHMLQTYRYIRFNHSILGHKNRNLAQPQICWVKTFDRNLPIKWALSTFHITSSLPYEPHALGVYFNDVTQWCSMLNSKLVLSHQQPSRNPNLKVYIWVKENEAAGTRNVEIWISRKSKGFHFNVFATTIKTSQIYPRT